MNIDKIGLVVKHNNRKFRNIDNRINLLSDEIKKIRDVRKMTVENNAKLFVIENMLNKKDEEEDEYVYILYDQFEIRCVFRDLEDAKKELERLEELGLKYKISERFLR